VKLSVKKGTTSKRVGIRVESVAGGPLTGLAWNTASLTWYYWREDQGNANATAVTLATMTRGTWATGGFVEKDATNMPGFYEIGIPNAALATAADWVSMVLRGAANMVEVAIEIQLVDNTALDIYDRIGAAGAGLTSIPWNASWDAEVESEVRDALETVTHAEPSAVLAATASLKDRLVWISALARNKVTQTSTTQALRNDADGANIATAAVSDDGTTFIRAEWV
jgi:hypothetical protein